MAIFGGVELTNAGKILLAKAMTGKTLKFIKGYAGNGALPEGQSIAELTDLISPRREMEITNMDVPADVGIAKITLMMSNKDLVQGFLLREIGLFARHRKRDFILLLQRRRHRRPYTRTRRTRRGILRF